MKLLVLGTPNAIETKWIIKEAIELGHTAHALSLYNVRLSIFDHKLLVSSLETDILSYDAYLFRGITRHLWEALLLAEYLYSQGKTVVDKRLATTRYIPSKASTAVALANAKISQPKTIIPMGKKEALEELRAHAYPVVIKDAWGRQGKRVNLANNYTDAKQIVEQFVSQNCQYLIQEYIPVNYDTRVFVVGDKALGGMKRTAPEGDFRSNISIGGIAEPVALSKDIQEIAVKAASAASMEIAGVDILTHNQSHYVLEVNRCPQFRGFQPATGINVAKGIVEYIVTRMKSRQLGKLDTSLQIPPV